MKKSRLLEIIREEISAVLHEGEAEDKAAQMAALKATDLEIKALQKKKAELMKTGVSESEELNEIPDFGGRFDQQVASKYGEDQTLEDATRDITDEVLKDMGLSKDDLKKDADKAKEVLKAIRSKVVGKNQDPRVAKALAKQTEFDDSGNPLQANQTNNAILKALGLKEPGARGRKATEKPAEAPKAKKETSPKSAPKAETSDDEEVVAATKAAGSDSTAKELASTPEEKKVKFNQFLASVKKNKDDKAKIDGILKLAKDKFKFAKSMMDDLKRAAGREVEA
jgi:hypothetical protein